VVCAFDSRPCPSIHHVHSSERSMFRIALPLATVTLTTVLLIGGLPGQLMAGGNRAELVSQSDARRFGLERAWFTRVSIDSSVGEISHISQHVSSTNAYTVFELTYDGGKLVFSERDVDKYGKRIDKLGAQKLAERRREELEVLELSPNVTDRTVQEITLYVTTNRGIVQAIDGETGRTRWITEAGRAGQAIEAAGANDDYVAAINGSTIYVLRAADGKLVWKRKVRGAPNGGPVLSQKLLFAPMVNGNIEIYDLDDHELTPRVFQSTGRVGRPIYTGDVVAWPTDRGHVYISQADAKNMLYQVETGHPITTPATALNPGRLLAASTGGYVYCIEKSSGAILWRFSTGEPIEKSPMTVGEAIYVVTEGGSLFRLSGKTGLEEWSTTGIRRFLSVSEKRLYCVAESGPLLVLSAETGGRLGALASVLPSVQIENRMTDRIFIGTRGGFIQCLHEIENEWPVIHLDAAEIAAPETEEKPAQPTATETPTDQPAELNPFATPPAGADADPFSSGNDADPFSNTDPEVTADDPFDSPF
jgi:outer membrane protein assembly factor BamB